MKEYNIGFDPSSRGDKGCCFIRKGNKIILHHVFDPTVKEFGGVIEMKNKSCICGARMVRLNGMDRSKWWVCHWCGHMEARGNKWAPVLIGYITLVALVVTYILVMEGLQ